MAPDATRPYPDGEPGRAVDGQAPPPAVHDCWNQIGVKGDGSCPELKRFVHCRNCPVFAAAGRSLFEREPPPGYLQEWTRRLAEPEAAESDDTIALVVFRAGEEWLAVEAGAVVEVAEPRPVHTVPHHSNRVLKGLVNIRGELHLCASLPDLLAPEAEPRPQPGGAPAAGRHAQKLLVVERGCRWVLVVDEVHGVVRFPQIALTGAPATVARGRSSLSRGVFRWDGRDVGLLDDTRLFEALKAKLG